MSRLKSIYLYKCINICYVHTYMCAFLHTEEYIVQLMFIPIIAYSIFSHKSNLDVGNPLYVRRKWLESHNNWSANIFPYFSLTQHSWLWSWPASAIFVIQLCQSHEFPMTSFHATTVTATTANPKSLTVVIQFIISIHLQWPYHLKKVMLKFPPAH